MPVKSTVIFANGEQANPENLRRLLQPGDYLVAADGGLKHLIALGLRPDLLIGDLDSVTPEQVAWAKQVGARVAQYPVHKDETDLELALQAVVREGFQSILILGALGGRLDMTLANISLLMLPELAGLDVRLGDGSDEVFLIYPGEQGKEIAGQPGDRVSLLPWGGLAGGICTQGLYYPLKGENLYPERTRGISNKMIGERAQVTLQTGLLICIHTHSDG